MKKMCVMLAIAICFGMAGCKKSTPEAPKPAPKAVEQPKPAAQQAAPATQQPAAQAQQTATQTQQAAQETTQKAAETAKPAAEQAAQAMTATAADVDLTSPIDKLKEQAKSMNADALKATAEKYKTQFMTMKDTLAAKTELLNKIPLTDKLGPEAQALTKDIKTITDSMASIKERMGVYVDALKAKGVDTSSLGL